MKTARHKRAGMALMLTMFLMVITTVIVVTILDTITLQYAAQRNTIAWDKARYLAEAGAAHALAELESNIAWRTGVPSTEFPSGSGNTYSVSVVDGSNNTIVITSLGTAGGFTRTVQVTIREE